MVSCVPAACLHGCDCSLRHPQISDGSMQARQPAGDDHTQMPVASVPRLHEEQLSAPGNSPCDVASSHEDLTPPHRVPSRKPALQVCALTASHALRPKKVYRLSDQA